MHQSVMQRVRAGRDQPLLHAIAGVDLATIIGWLRPVALPVAFLERGKVELAGQDLPVDGTAVVRGRG